MRTLHLLGLTVSATVLLAACHTTPITPATNSAQNTAPQTTVAKPDPRTVGVVDTGSVDPLNDAKGILAQRSVYFDFDSYSVKSDYNALINAHSNYLESHKTRKILVQGNTDERGGSEYNLALGQKRAEAVAKVMETLGVPAGQIEAVSFGKEKPKSTGHDEAAWSQNRRDDIVYAGTK